MPGSVVPHRAGVHDTDGLSPRGYLSTLGPGGRSRMGPGRVVSHYAGCGVP